MRDSSTFQFYVISWKNLLHETVSPASQLTLPRICPDGTSESVIGQKHPFNGFLILKLAIASEIKEGMKAFAVYLKPSRISPQSRIMMRSFDDRLDDAGDRKMVVGCSLYAWDYALCVENGM
jgi:hypothetical protein